MLKALNALLSALVIAAALMAMGGDPAAAAASPRPVDQAAFATRKRIQRLPSGVELAYVEMGDPRGQPVVFIHGFTDNARTWTLLTPYLDPRFRIILVDLRGHGGSSKPACCYRLQDMTADIDAFLTARHIDRADVVGHSLGSAVTQVFAETYPKRVRRVVLISSTLGGPPPATTGAKGESFDLAGGIAKLKDPIDPDSAFMRDWYSTPTPVDPAFLARERRDSAAIPVRVWLAVLKQASMGGLGAGISRLKAPVLILSGDKDPFFGPPVQAELRRALPHAKARAFPDAGHNLIWEDPKGAAEAINAFLAP